jgi:hypothetical protein
MAVIGKVLWGVFRNTVWLLMTEAPVKIKLERLTGLVKVRNCRHKRDKEGRDT